MLATIVAVEVCANTYLHRCTSPANREIDAERPRATVHGDVPGHEVWVESPLRGTVVDSDASSADSAVTNIAAEEIHTVLSAPPDKMRATHEGKRSS